MESIQSYAIFLIPMATGLIAEMTKFTIFTIKYGWKPHRFMSHGHMPSSHTAFMVATIVSIGYYSGLDSGAFAVALVLAIVVIDDAIRLRVIIGDHGRYMNVLIRKLPVDKKEYPRLKERVGHRISEVIAGAILGAILSSSFIGLIGQ